MTRALRWISGIAGLGTFAVLLLAGATVCLTSGCSTIGYYAQSVSGHLGLVRAAKPVPDWLADPSTPPALKARLELSQRIRDFAVTELHEPDNASYRRYADLHRSAVLWNVVAAPELSLKPVTWCFVVVGCVGYRGYYDEAAARRFADGLRTERLDVDVYGVPAYSTLGLLPGDTFADPLLNTFIDYPEGALARLIFHELAHQIVFAKGDTVFNESFATAVERLGVERWLSERASPGAREVYDRYESRQRDFRTLTMRYRDRFEALYASPIGDTWTSAPASSCCWTNCKHRDYASLKQDRWGGYAGYDDLGSPRPTTRASACWRPTTRMCPNSSTLFEREGRDFPRFYAEVKRLAALPPAERRQALECRIVATRQLPRRFLRIEPAFCRTGAFQRAGRGARIIVRNASRQQPVRVVGVVTVGDEVVRILRREQFVGADCSRLPAWRRVGPNARSSESP